MKEIKETPRFTGSGIRNKIKRSEALHKFRDIVNKEKSDMKKKRRKEEQADPSLLEKRLTENIQKTIDNTREFDETVVDDNDEEIAEEEELDEFSSYFNKERLPKVLITTCINPSSNIYGFTDELSDILPNSQFVKRGKQFEVKHIIEFSNKREFSDIIIVNEDKKKVNSMTLIHLPNGPTAHFRLSSVKLSREISGHGRATAHTPELILNSFTTRLGHIIGRMFQSLFPPVPEFQGRQVATFHNQRDFIFFRRHRYEFRSGERVDLQELGPKFTLKLKWLQKGLFDPENGDYEWKFKGDMETSRRRFFL